jgi:hypothetical protein
MQRKKLQPSRPGEQRKIEVLLVKLPEARLVGSRPRADYKRREAGQGR